MRCDVTGLCGFTAVACSSLLPPYCLCTVLYVLHNFSRSLQRTTAPLDGQGVHVFVHSRQIIDEDLLPDMLVSVNGTTFSDWGLNISITNMGNETFPPE